MASGVGQTLRKARTDRGLELSEVERATKIRVKFLEALEEERWDALPAPAYARGFLDIYARYLGLDHKELLDEYSRSAELEGAEPIPGSVIKPGTLRQTRQPRRTSIKIGPVAKVAAGIVLVVIVALVVVGSIGGSDDNGGEKPKKAKGNGTKAAGPATTASTTTTSTTADQVSVELRSTADVWVCLVDQSGSPLVDSETLGPDETRGPFNADGFEVTFGNGSVELTVDGQPEAVPQVAEPIGYRITPSGVRRLAPSAQPTCI